MKRFLNKSMFIGFIVGGILFLGIGVFATTVIMANQVSYDNSVSNLTGTNVQSAIDELNTKTNIGTATSDNIANGKTALVGGKTITGTGADISNAISSQWNSIATDSDLIAKGYSGVNDLASLKTAINASITNSYNEGYSKGNIDGAANSQAVTINYHSHSSSCYKTCGGSIATYGHDKFGTEIAKCTKCGYDYTYYVGGGESYVGPRSCVQQTLQCGRNSSNVDSVVVGGTVYTTS